MQQLARLSAIPGITPQMIQSFAELSKTQSQSNARANAFSKQEPKPLLYPGTENKENVSETKSPSLTNSKGVEETLQGYVPPSENDIEALAGKLYNANPAAFAHDFTKARERAESTFLKKQQQNEAQQKIHATRQATQDNVVNRLTNHSSQLGAKIPANLYSKIEDKALESVKPISEGGRGLTEQQAVKEYGKEIDQASRDYQEAEDVGNWGMTGRRPAESARLFRSLQKKFRERDDTENYADSLVSKNGLSPTIAYQIAEPVSEVPKLNSELERLPNIRNKKFSWSIFGDTEESREKTRAAIPKLAKSLGDGSPLAVAAELEQKGYDPDLWMDYVTKHADELKLNPGQVRQTEKPRNFLGTFNDWWLTIWSGLDKGEK